MIIPRGVKPEFSLYYIGARILHAIIKHGYESNVFELYENIKKIEANYSLNQYLMALNWLYLLGAIDLTNDGKLKLC